MTATLTATATERYVGRCPNCGAGVATDNFVRGAGNFCHACSTVVVLKKIEGVFNGHVSCDDRCEFAVGPACSCACGGENHSIGYVSWTMVPVWITQRDAKRLNDAKDRKATRARQTKTDREAAVSVGIERMINEAAGLEILLSEDLYENYGYFVSDIATQFKTNGQLSDRQISSVLNAVEKINTQNALQAVRETKIASGVIKPAPVGKVTVTGTVVGFYTQETNFGGELQTTSKAIVETTEGWKVAITKPAKFEIAKGDKISFNATLKAGSDEFFAYGTYLSKIVVG